MAANGALAESIKSSQSYSPRQLPSNPLDPQTHISSRPSQMSQQNRSREPKTSRQRPQQQQATPRDKPVSPGVSQSSVDHQGFSRTSVSPRNTGDFPITLASGHFNYKDPDQGSFGHLCGQSWSTHYDETGAVQAPSSSISSSSASLHCLDGPTAQRPMRDEFSFTPTNTAHSEQPMVNHCGMTSTNTAHLQQHLVDVSGDVHRSLPSSVISYSNHPKCKYTNVEHFPCYPGYVVNPKPNKQKGRCEDLSPRILIRPNSIHQGFNTHVSVPQAPLHTENTFTLHQDYSASVINSLFPLASNQNLTTLNEARINSSAACAERVNPRSNLRGPHTPWNDQNFQSSENSEYARPTTGLKTETRIQDGAPSVQVSSSPGRLVQSNRKDRRRRSSRTNQTHLTPAAAKQELRETSGAASLVRGEPGYHHSAVTPSSSTPGAVSDRLEPAHCSPEDDNHNGGPPGSDISASSLTDSGVSMLSSISLDNSDRVSVTLSNSNDSIESEAGGVPPIPPRSTTRKPSFLSAVQAPPPLLRNTAEAPGQRLYRRISYLEATAGGLQEENSAPSTLLLTSATVPFVQRVKQKFPPQPAITVNGSPLHAKSPEFLFESLHNHHSSHKALINKEETSAANLHKPIDIVRQGSLLCRITFLNGRKCTDRAWRAVFAILHPFELVLSKENEKDNTASSLQEHHIPLKLCMVEWAKDYSKKNVFRISTHDECQYLLQAEDHKSLLGWVQAIKSIYEPLNLDRGLSAPFPSDFTGGSTSDPSNMLSPVLSTKGKKSSAFNSKSKVVASPAVTRKRREATEKEKEENAKKGWKDLIPKISLKRHNEDLALSPPPDPDAGSGQVQFGVPLEECCPSPHNKNVPLIVELCTRIVEARGLEVVGVYRVPGNSAVVSALIEEFNQGIETVNLDNEKLLDINMISSLLKSFLRKLPEPLIPSESYEAFIDASRCTDEVNRKLKIKQLLHQLPAHHRATFQHMAEHLNKVSSYGHINKMDAKNLAIVFGPTLVCNQSEDTLSLVADMTEQCRIVESIILNPSWFFESWDPNNTETWTAAPVLGDQAQLSPGEQDSATSTRAAISSLVSAARQKIEAELKPKNPGSISPAESCTTLQEHLTGDSLHPAPSLASLYSSSGSSENSKERLEPLTSVEASFRNYSARAQHEAISSDFHTARITGMPSASFVRPNRDDLSNRNGWKSDPRGLQVAEQEVAVTPYQNEYYNVNASMLKFETNQKGMYVQEIDNLQRVPPKRWPEIENKDGRAGHWSETGFNGLSKVSNVVSGLHTLSAFHEKQAALPNSHLKKYTGSGRALMNHNSKLETPFSILGNKKYVVNDRQPDRLSLPQHDAMLRCGSAENILDDNHQLKKDVFAGESKLGKLSVEQENPLTFSSVSSVRDSKKKVVPHHRSLDTLIDLLDMQHAEGDSSWPGSDSEDGTDLLVNQKTTFDQRLHILLDPRYKLTRAANSLHDHTTESSEGSKYYNGESETSAENASAVLQASPRSDTRFSSHKHLNRHAQKYLITECSSNAQHQQTDDQTVLSAYQNLPTSVAIPQSIKRSQSKSEKSGRRSRSRHRRHSVGGEADHDHEDAVTGALTPTAGQDQTDGRRSAWDQLQPAVRQQQGLPEPLSLQTWILQERLRGSTPNLSVLL